MTVTTQQKKTTALAIFVKTPGLSDLKTRLAAEVGVEEATSIYLSSVKGVEASIQALTDAVPNISVFYAVAEQQALDSPFWQRFETTWQGEGELGFRLGRIFNRLKETHDNVILIGGDTPHIPGQWLIDTVNSLNAEDEPLTVFGPARDGGFYLFGANYASVGMTLGSIEYSRPTTLEDLAEQLFEKSAFTWLPQLTDIDTKDDLKHVAEEIAKYAPLLADCQTLIRG